MSSRNSFQRFEAQLDRGSALWRAGDYKAAALLLKSLRLEMGSKALSKWPNRRMALALLAVCLGETRQFKEALELQAELLMSMPANREHRDNFVKMIEDAGHDLPESPLFQNAILTVMNRIDLSRLAVPLGLALLNRPGFKDAFAAMWKLSPDHVAALLLQGEFAAVFQAPLLQRLMDEVVIPLPEFEQGLTGLRHAILTAFVDDTLAVGYKRFARREKIFLGVFAHYSWLTEYAFCVTEEEYTALAALETRIVSAMDAESPDLSEGLLHAMNVYALYRPLEGLCGLEKLLSIATNRWPPPWRPMVLEWGKCQEEEELKKEIRQLTPIVDPISNTVRDQYEANPYPRWKHRLANVARISLADLMMRLCPAVDLPEKLKAPCDVLVAGCGTGLEAFHTWHQVESSSILAVDLSRSSLAYAMRMAQSSGIGRDIRFCQADILELGHLDQSFDFISSTGVLHHLDDPLKGWRVLTKLLKPGGVMCIGLYSEKAGQTVVRARQLARARGLEPTVDDMRLMRGEVLGSDAGELIQLTSWRDFYSLSMFRDLVFHANEHRFTPVRIQQCLDQLGLEFLFMADLEPSMRQRYAAMFPEDPWGTALENWAVFEEHYPHTFVGMYRFFVQKRKMTDVLPRSAGPMGGFY